jgi:hypothetical protein
MRLSWKKIVVGVVLLAIAVAGASWATKWLWPSVFDRRPKLAEIPPLMPVTLSSMIIVPATITLTAIQNAIEKAAPLELSGKPELPVPLYVSNAEMSWSISRSGFAVTGRPEGLSISTDLSGSLRASGQMTGPTGTLGGFSGSAGGLFSPPPGALVIPPEALGGLLGIPGGRPGVPGGSGRPSSQSQGNGTFDERAELAGNIVLSARPNLLPEWRMEPNLAAQVSIADASITYMGSKLSLSKDLKPIVERSVNEQVSTLQAQMRHDPSLEYAMRREWGNLCRSFALGKVAPGMPDVWLELRPTRAFAAQPRVDQSSVGLAFGLQADTRIVPNETKPNCPFPAQLELVPQMEQGHINIALPVDIPFTEISRLLEAQLKGKTFPEESRGAFLATVRTVSLAASGDRLLLSLGLNVSESKSWFGFGADAVIHVWARPVLDRSRQVIRLDDIAVDVESQAALGLLGAAAKAAVPALERAVARNAVVDLQPLAANARKSIEAAIAEFHKNVSGVRLDTAVTNLRLAGIEFDAKTLRVMGEATGTVRVAISAFP